MTASTPPAVCKSGRWAFLTQTAAVEARRAARSSGRVYECELCAGWHWVRARPYGRLRRLARSSA